MGDRRTDSVMDRWWWGVLCGAAGSLLTTLAFLVFMVMAGYIHLDLPSHGSSSEASSPLGVRKPIAVSGQPLFTMRGSTTIGDDLAPLMVQSFMQQQGYGDVQVGRPSDSVNAAEQVVVGKGPDGAMHFVRIVSEGSKTAPPALLDGSADIGMMSSRMKDDQAATITGKFGGDPRRAGAEYVVALDGVAAIVNSSSTMGSITIAKLADAFSTATDWSQVGRGTGGAIKIERRDDKSGTTDVFKALVMGDKPMAHGEQLADNKAVASAVAGSPDAIGYVGAGFVVDGVKALGVAAADGSKAILPDPEQIKLETYPLARRLYLYVAPNGRAPIVDAFLRFAVSEKADALVQQAGETPLTVMRLANSEAMPLAQAASAGSPNASAYLDAIAHADQLTVDFRFSPGGDDLDVRALEDLQRLKAYLASSGKSASQIRLIGFSDGSGDDVAQASKADADRVADSLRGIGVVVPPAQVIGAGVAPIMPGDSPEAKRRNRRVEVWIAG